MTLVVTPAATGSGLADFYNTVSTYANVTAPQAIHAQSMHVYTGGSLFLRSPNRTYSLFSASAPSLRAGCGGIDIFGGSFSFIDADEFVQILRQIGQNAAGLFFMTALQSMAPELSEIIKYLNHMAQMVNATNINTCEIASKLVNASLPQKINEANTSNASMLGTIHGLIKDSAERMAKFMGNDARSRQIQDAVRSDPDINPKLTQGNLVWRAMSRSGLSTYLGEKEMRLAMSTVGAVVLSLPPGAPESAPPTLSYKPSTITFDRLVGKGDDATPAADKPKVITCIDGTLEDQCTQMGEEDYDGKPFSDVAYSKAIAIYNKIRNRVGLTTEDYAFVNSTSVPIYRVLAVAATYPTDSVAHAAIEKYKDVIGAELAAAFILKATEEVEKALMSRNYEVNEAEKEALNRILDRISQLRNEIHQKRTSYYAQLNQLAADTERIAFMERTYTNNLAERVAANLRFSQRIRGQI